MTKPEEWECSLWHQVLDTLNESGRTESSYYVMAEEAVKLCDRENDHE